MSEVKVSTHFNIDLEFIAPPFHRRLGAWLIDLILGILYVWFASVLINSIYFEDRMASGAISLLVWLPLILYHFLCEVLMNGQSIGKKLLGMRVVSENGGKPSIGQFVIRFLIRTSDLMIVVSIFIVEMIQYHGPEVLWFIGGSFLLLVIDIILVNTKKQQRLGDLLANTMLIETKQKEDISNTIFQEVADSYVPSFPQVMRLSDRDINALKAILDTARKRQDYDMAEMAAIKIRNHLQIETSLSAYDFLDVLLKDYNYLSTR
jgi:uncharacterized RDD family membrane protein YckC